MNPVAGATPRWDNLRMAGPDTLCPHCGAGSIVGAGSVVVRDVPDGVLAYGVPAYGVPAKVIRKVRDDA